MASPTLPPEHPPIQFLSLDPQNNRGGAMEGQDNGEDTTEQSLPLIPAPSLGPQKTKWSDTLCITPKFSCPSPTQETGTAPSAPGHPPARTHRRKAEFNSEVPDDDPDWDATSIRLTPPSSPGPLAVHPQFLATDAETTQSDGSCHLEFQTGPGMPRISVSGVAGLPFTGSEPIYERKLLPLGPSAAMDYSMWRSAKRSCDDSGYSSLSHSEGIVELEAAKDGPIKSDSLPVVGPVGPAPSRLSPSFRGLPSSARTRDTGYVPDSPMHDWTAMAQYPSLLAEPERTSKNITEPPPAFRDATAQADTPFQELDRYSSDPIPTFHVTNDSNNEPETSSIDVEYGCPEQVTPQDTEITTADTPLNDLIDVDNEDENSALDDGTVPGTPSPLQAAKSAESERMLVQTLWRLVDVFNDIASPPDSANSSPQSSGASSPVVTSMDGVRAHKNGPDYGRSSLSSSGLVGFATKTDASRSNKPRGGGDFSRDSDDGDDNEPNRKRPRLPMPEPPPPRRRFACPYQKFDALGSPYCYVRTNKNPEGGADTFSRIKFHVLQNHDQSVRCHNCWKVCKTQTEAEAHQIESKCIQKMSPFNYWMTPEQRDQVRQQKFTATNTANWFCLFRILLPGVRGLKHLSPYYTPDLPVLSTPGPSSGSSEKTRSSGQAAPFSHNCTDSLVESQQLLNPFQGVLNSDSNLSPFLNSLNADSAMDDVIRWDDSNAFNDPINQNTQAQLTDGLQLQPMLPPTTVGILGNAPTPPEIGQLPSADYDQKAYAGAEFLQQDRNRLRNNNTRLRVEVETLRRRDREMQAQLNQHRDSMVPLEQLLQELLYEPAVQNGERGVSNRVFAIFSMVESMNKALGPVAGG